ncbi:MAG: hypothetical protein EOP83_01185 [Verrucomicrobiaceae bacterium]|nr:MAG: hypothetical protein EOP83_01185 [Verrucomicrobiaceae bacterium]
MSSGKTLDYSFKEVDGKIQMRDLRSREERAADVVLSDQEKITRLSHKLVTVERLMDQMMRDTEVEIVGLNRRIVDMAPYHDCYKILQETILKNPTLIIEWQRFCMMLKMTDPDQSKYDEALGISRDE